MDEVTASLKSVKLDDCPIIVITKDSNDEIIRCKEHVENHQLLAFDCEGVDLGRCGEISLVQLSTTEQSYLFDVYNVSADHDMILLLKSILENPEVIKIVHDCKMDSDALFHLLNITLVGVHDTQVWDSVINGNEHNLNRTLVSYGCNPNAERDGNVYNVNHAFWATRPLTSRMIEWAGGDVNNLFALQKAQLKKLESMRSLQRLQACTRKSEENAAFLRDKMVKSDRISGRCVGKFIGRGELLLTWHDA